MPNPDPIQSKAFIEQQGKGRKQGSKNKATIAKEAAYVDGYQAALNLISQGRSGGIRGSNPKVMVGGLSKLASSPATKAVGGALLNGLSAPAGLVAAIIAEWNAEKFIKGYPPILHALIGLISTGTTWLLNELPDIMDEFTDKYLDGITCLALSEYFPSITEWWAEKPSRKVLGTLSIGVYELERSIFKLKCTNAPPVERGADCTAQELLNGTCFPATGGGGGGFRTIK